MKKITIIIPTRNRFDKLQKCLNSIPKVDYLETWVICDNDPETFIKLSNFREDVTVYQNNKHEGSVVCRNFLTPLVPDGLIYLTDDMWFPEDFDFEKLIEIFNRNFPDDDGVIGIPQNLPDYHPTGAALVGQKFLQRYPEKKLFNPAYYTFACQEVYDLAETIENLFIMWHQKVNHDHPAFNSDLIDKTHHDARKFKNKDMNLMKKRQKQGLIWGYN